MKALLVLVLFSASALSVDVNWRNVRPLLEYPQFTGEANAEPFVIGGRPADEHQFPFLVGLISTMSYGDALCGGSLINRRSILTAASCLQGASGSIIFFGAHNLQSTTERYQARLKVTSANYRIHPEYSRRARVLVNDVAMVRLTWEIGFFHRAVSPISILQNGDAANPLIMMGFGRTTLSSVGNSYTKSFVQVNAMANQHCNRNTLFPSFNPIPIDILDQHICTAGNTGSSLCSGSLGGPLIVIRNGQPQQIGIASFYDRNCQRNDPSVFTRTQHPAIFNWIKANE